MYSLDINFLKERAAEGPSQVAPTEGQAAAGASPSVWLPAIGGAIVGAVLVGGVFLYGRQVDGQIATLETEVATLQTELASLQASQQKIQERRQALNEQQALTQSLANIFDQVRPMTAVLQDVRDRLPAGVELDSLEQQGERPDVQIDLQGLADSYSAITTFALAMERSQFVREGTVRLSNVRETEYPLNNTDELPEGIEPEPVFGYTLTATLNDTSAGELLDELRRKGADGFAARIEALRSQGIVSGANAEAAAGDPAAEGAEAVPEGQ